jgi:hypothetical protein
MKYVQNFSWESRKKGTNLETQVRKLIRSIGGYRHETKLNLM